MMMRRFASKLVPSLYSAEATRSSTARLLFESTAPPMRRAWSEINSRSRAQNSFQLTASCHTEHCEGATFRRRALEGVVLALNVVRRVFVDKGLRMGLQKGNARGPQHGAKSGEETDPPAPVIVTRRSRQSVTRGGFAPETEQERAALARSVDTIEEYYTEVGKPKPWLSAAPLPPLIGLMALSALAAGCTEHATRVLFASTSNLKQLVAIATVFATVLVLPMVIVVVTRAPLRFIPYFATKGKIPLWLRPAGVWGPNALRLTLGVLVEDFAHSRKSLGALFFFTRNLVALFAGLDLESSGSCATAAWVQAFVFLGLAALTVVLRPFRSKFLFATGVLSVSATFLFLVAYLVHTAYFLNESSATSPLSTTANPNQSGSDHWSVVALFITAAVASVASVLSVAGQLAVALWETVQFSAFAHVHRDGTHESGVSVVQPVDSMLDEMLAVYNAGPAEPLDSEDAAHAGLASLDSRAVILQSKIPRPLAAKNNAAAQPPATAGSKRRDKRRGSRVRFNDEVEVEPSDRRPPSDRKDRRPQRDPGLDSDEAGPTGAFAGGMWRAALELSSTRLSVGGRGSRGMRSYPSQVRTE